MLSVFALHTQRPETGLLRQHTAAGVRCVFMEWRGHFAECVWERENARSQVFSLSVCNWSHMLGVRPSTLLLFPPFLHLDFTLTLSIYLSMSICPYIFYHFVIISLTLSSLLISFSFSFLWSQHSRMSQFHVFHLNCLFPSHWLCPECSDMSNIPLDTFSVFCPVTELE